jgi:hypothetical protein
MSDCPTRIELSRWEAAPELARPLELTEHVRVCGRCSAIFDDIVAARSLLLGADPVETSARAARAIMEKVHERRNRRRWLGLIFPIFLVPAAAALLLLAKPVLDTPPTKPASQVRIMGHLILETYCKRGEDQFLAEDGADYLAKDRLRFAYSVDKPGFLLLFGVDDQGKVFPYYQENALVGIPVEPGAKVLLPDAVELDDHKGWERIFALWSETQLTESAVRTAISAAFSQNSDLRHITSLDLPVDQVSMLLRRP